MDDLIFNYAEDKLNFLTVQSLFGEEQDRFRKEGVPWQPVLWSDYHLTLELLQQASARALL